MSKRKRPNVSLMLDPLKIAYSQNSISFKFANGTLLSTAITKLGRGTLKVGDFPPIRVFHLNNTWYSLDNRRLYVFKEAAKKGIFTSIPVLDTPSSEIRRSQEIDAKLTTMNAGRQVTVRGAAARAVVTTKCHYCLKECTTAGHLSLHCQEDHLEEYQEEVRATSLTIDQFLMGKDFCIKDDLLVSLEHLQVEANNSEEIRVTREQLTSEFQKLGRVRQTSYEKHKLSIRRTILRGDVLGDKENLPVSSCPVSSCSVVVKGRSTSLATVHWQDGKELSSSDIYFTNLFAKGLHFRDVKYPLS